MSRVTTTSATRALDSAGVMYTLHLHDRPVTSLEQAAAERGLRPSQIVRSLVFRQEGSAFVLVLAPGPRQISWAKLRRHLGVSRLTTASADEVVAATGYTPGSVSPFGLASPLRILADQRLAQEDIVSVGAGIRNAGIILSTEDLLRLLQPEMGEFLEGPEAP
jgi:Cys-tRNA(Pro) deacylase